MEGYMRIVGNYKGSDIRITGLHMSETYGSFLAGPTQSLFESVNWEMINVGIPQRAEKMWGKDLRVHVMELDFKKRLPGIEVLAKLNCSESVKDGDCSDLILAWFQESDEDPFAKATTNLKKFSWEEKARTYDPANL
jgi:hypothetical protein